MNHSPIQLIECVTTANKDALQSLLAVGFYALAIKKDLQEIVSSLDFQETATRILFIEDEENKVKQYLNIEAIAQAYQEGERCFYSAIKGRGGYLSTEKLLTYFQTLHIDTGINLLAFESAYNEFLFLTS